MKRRFGLTIVGLAAAATLAIAQGAKDQAGAPEFQLPPGMTEADMEACMLAGMPGEEHAFLVKAVGTWKGKGKMWMTPEAEAVESECVAVITSILDGRFTQCDIEGEMPGMGAFVGRGIYGFDNVSGQFQSTHIGNCMTGTMRGTGALSSDGKTLTWVYEYHCPISQKPTTMREIERRIDDNTITFETFSICPKTGKEFKTMELTMKRQKGSPISAR